MSDMKFVLSVDDVAVEQFSSPAGFEELLDFLGREDVRATFFVVPFEHDIPLYDRKEWRELIRRAIGEGHDLQLHGYRHEPFECGIPPDFVLAYERECRQAVMERRSEIEQNVSVIRLEERLGHGLDILSRLFGYRPTGFRAPYLSTHPNLFAALQRVGIEWDSSIAVNPKGWHYISGDYDSDADWLDDRPRIGPLPSGVIEVPLTTEYTWYLRDGDIDRQYRLLEEDMNKFEARGGVLVTLAHVGPMTGPYGAALTVYKRAFDYLRERNIACITVRQAVDEWKREGGGSR